MVRVSEPPHAFGDGREAARFCRSTCRCELGRGVGGTARLPVARRESQGGSRGGSQGGSHGKRRTFEGHAVRRAAAATLRHAPGLLLQ